MARKDPNKVVMYNVPKKLVQSRGNARLLGFKYPQSSDGYAHVILDKSELQDMNKNDKSYFVTLDRWKAYDFVYKSNGCETSCKKRAHEIKTLFDNSRLPQAQSNREILEFDDSCDLDALLGMESPFD